MPSKKKSKPSYNVPEELQTAPQAGWVYRSDVSRSPEATPKSFRKPQATTVTRATPASKTAGKSATPIPAPQTPPIPAAPSESPKDAKSTRSHATASKSSDGIMDLAARTISSSFEAIGNAVLLTTRIITAPISMGMKMLGLK